VTIGSPGGLQIVLRWDSSVSSAPSGFMTAVEAAAQFYVNTFDDPVTITLNVGWGEITQNGTSEPINSPGEALGGPNAGTPFTYDQVLAALRADATSAADLTSIASLAAETFNGMVYISSAEEKALGLTINTPGGSTDGAVGFSAPPNTFTYNFDPNNRAVAGEADFVGIAEHELAHAMGRFSPLAEAGFPFYSILDLFRFSAPGARELTGGQPAYFSIDGGATNLDNFDTTSDFADWNGSNGPDSYNAIYSIGVEDSVTATDVTEMNILGFTLTADAGELPVLWIDDSTGAIGTVNPANGAVTVIGASGQTLTDIAFSTSGRLYGVTASALYSINPLTGAATFIGNLDAGNDGIDSLAWADGALYAALSATQQLYAVNTTTGLATELTGTLPAAASGDLVFADGALYINDANGNLDRLTITGSQVTATVAFSLTQSGITGLAPGLNGIIYGVAGSQLQIIDPSTGTITPALSYSGQGLGSARGMTEMVGQPAPRDFNGSGTSDLLWRDGSGDVAIWEISNATVAAGGLAGFADPASWSIRGAGEFDGDGNADILWQQSSGNVAIWDMSGISVVASSLVGFADPASWSIVATGDFNGDGTSDILWRQSSGNVALWEMSADTIAASAVVGFADPTWTIRGAGDFNGDGKSDILWQDTAGDVAIWEMNGLSVLASAIVGFADPATWTLRGSGDFNGDGKSDLVWQDTSGDVAIWEMNGFNVMNTAIVGFASPATWHIAGVGDYNGDGMSGILWQDTAGDVTAWEMNGTTIAAAVSVGFASPATWHLAPSDSTGDTIAAASPPLAAALPHPLPIG
jgi:hypothetical protein